MSEDMNELYKEAQWVMDEYERCFGTRKVIGYGTPMARVHSMQAAVIRHYVEEMKKAIADVKQNL